MIALSLVTDKTRFQCKRCTKCCSLDVMLSDREMADLTPHVDRSWRTTKKSGRGKRLVCCLLDGDACGIYPNRPVLCRVYPFFAVPSEELALLAEPLQEGALKATADDGRVFYFLYDESCPGIGEGAPVPVEGVLELTLRHLSEMERKTR